MRKKTLHYKEQISGNRECLDFVKTIYRHKIYPLIYCSMEMEGHLDINRLTTAIRQTGYYVPEILCAYRFRHGKFIDKGFSADDTIVFGDDLFLWNLNEKPQLRINIRRQAQQDIVTIGISHILTDSKGFLQYLYLLAFLYNNPYADLSFTNRRELAPVLKNIHVRKQTEQTRYGKKEKVPPLRSCGKSTSHFCLVSRISEKDFTLLHAKAKKNNATLNDVFMTAYARVISRLKNIDTVTIPCPADLRRFGNTKDQLTVANMTGIYKRVTIEIRPQHTFTETLSQVHIEMELQKSRHRCFSGIKLLNCLYHRVPDSLLRQAIKAGYRQLPVSYANIGTIDHRKLTFQDCPVKSCYMTGTYRLPPDFQLTVSTFRNVCTLNCTLAGQPEDEAAGQYILEQVKKELLEWSGSG